MRANVSLVYLLLYWKVSTWPWWDHTGMTISVISYSSDSIIWRFFFWKIHKYHINIHTYFEMHYMVWKIRMLEYLSKLPFLILLLQFPLILVISVSHRTGHHPGEEIRHGSLILSSLPSLQRAHFYCRFFSKWRDFRPIRWIG